MKARVWVDGRLSWPLVAIIVFLAVSLVAVDLAWRVLVMPFDRLLVSAATIDGLVAVLGIGLYFALRRRRSDT
jgi:MYXO-CTERM domain-containing protein